MDGSTESPRLARAAFLFIAAIGIPAVAGLKFTPTLTSNPWRSIATFIAYETAVLIVGFSAKVWHHVEDLWVNSTAKWVDTTMQELRWRSRYLDYVVYRHRTFDVKGLTTQGVYTLEIEQVFVDLRLSPRRLTESQLISFITTPGLWARLRTAFGLTSEHSICGTSILR